MIKFVKYISPILVYLIIVISSGYIFNSTNQNIARYQLDKLIHLIEYGILAFLICRALTAYNVKKWLVYGVILSSAIGAVDELLQGLSPYRVCSFWDFSSDLIGAMLFAFIYYKYVWRNKNARV